MVSNTEIKTTDTVSSETSVTTTYGNKPEENTKKAAEASSAPIKDEATVSTVQTQNTGTTSAITEPETESKATEKDAEIIAQRLVEYINDYRNSEGVHSANILSGLTKYAEYRSNQLVTNFAHDTFDERAAATDLQYGEYIEPSLYGMTGEPYYIANAREVIAKTDYGGTHYGYETLQKAGFEYSMDNAYRTEEHIVARRHQGAEIALFFNRFGADVFVDTPRAERRKDFYVSAYSIRSASNGALLNNTQMIGFYYSDETMFVPYYVTKDDLGIYANVEQRNFNMQPVICGRKPFVVYTGANTLIEIADIVMTEKCRKEKQTYDTYVESFEKFECPVTIIPMNENGIRTLEILKLKDYRTQIAKAVLGENYLPPKNEHTDAISKSTGENYIVGIDCNIPRMKKAMALDTGAPNIIAFDYQVSTINKYCWGEVKKIDIAEVEQVFRLHRKCEIKNGKAFQTNDGSYVRVHTEHMKTR